MKQETINQIVAAANNNDMFALGAYGVLIYEGTQLTRDAGNGMKYIETAAQNGVLWARDMMRCIRGVDSSPEVRKHAIVTREAQMQLEQYAAKGNTWAATILGEAMYTGYGMPKDQDRAMEVLRNAQARGNLWAGELLGVLFIEHTFTTITDRIIASAHSLFGDDPPSPKPEKNAMEELDSLIGLTRVKEEVRSLKNFVVVQQKREQQGLKKAAVSYHCVFSGSPGTGKTTVARIVASIYKELGLLKKGHLVEVQRADLVAEYVGQTAPKVNAKIDEALDGILFIDEAYTLAQSKDDSFGQEAIDTLLKRMEDDRDRLVVIVAGYSNEIKSFINSNPGLQSRFNRYINFEDYTHIELMEIFLRYVKKGDYHISEAGHRKVFQKIYREVENKDSHFGNARFVRNLYENIIQRQANRISGLDRPCRAQLMEITEEDV